jgi:DGQHR domain-containing protein
MGYVLRRTSNKPHAYQRAINKERILNIKDFFSLGRVLLPNSIIIAFDHDPLIQNKINYNKASSLLTFSPKFCSAWIIDGQHRVYGFAGSKYDKKNINDGDDNFKLPVVAFKSLNELLQNKTFVNINYYQKKIDPTLFCNLSTEIKDLKNELTWPSLLGVELNKNLPWKNMIKISEYDTQRSITLSSFARYALLEFLLGYNKKLRKYNGPLYNYARFDPLLDFKNQRNKTAFKRQLQLLKRFFLSVHKNIVSGNPTKDIWKDFKKYSATKPTGVNAILLVLCRILEKYPDLQIANLDNYLEPVRRVDFSSGEVASFGGGWKGFRSFANHIIKKLNKQNSDSLKLFHKKRRKR